MATPLELISDRIPLKEDKSRLSIEGVLAGASLAVVLSVLWPVMAEAGEWVDGLLEGPGPVEGNPPEDGGKIKIREESLGIRPLDPTDYEPTEEVKLDGGGRSYFLENPPVRPIDREVAKENVDDMEIKRGPEGNLAGAGKASSEYDGTNEIKYPDVALRLVEDEKYITINVASPIESIGTSVYEQATGNATQSIQGLAGVNINILPPRVGGVILSYSQGEVLRDAINIDSITQRLLSTGTFKTTLDDVGERPSIGVNTTGTTSAGARAIFGDGAISVQTQNYGAFESTLSSFRNTAEYIYIKALDAIRLIGQVGGQIIGQSISTTTGINGNSITTGAGNDSLLIVANTSVDGYMSAGDEGINLNVGVNTIGVDGSSIRTGEGNDQLVIAATMFNHEDEDKAGVSIELENTSIISGGEINMNMKATGVNQSSINTGRGNDRVIIQTGIDEYLAAQVKGIKVESGEDLNVNVGKSIVAMKDSVLSTGEGNDIILIRGDVIGSTIDTGTGKDQLIVQGELVRSTIGIDSEDTFINVPLYGRTVTLSGDQSSWNTRETAEVSLVLGDEQSNSIISNGEFKEDITVLGKDIGKVYETAFSSMENVLLGGGDDNVSFENYGRLSGVLDGGSGYDTVSFERSGSQLYYIAGETRIGSLQEPVVSGGIQNFEEIIGSDNGDMIILGKRYDGSEDNIRQIRLGSGQDIIGFNNIEELRQQWDRIGGAPIIVNLDISDSDQIAYRYGTSDSEWYVQKDIIALPDDLIRNGTAAVGYGLRVGITDGPEYNGSLYLSDPSLGNIELARLRDIGLPRTGNETA